MLLPGVSSWPQPFEPSGAETRMPVVGEGIAEQSGRPYLCGLGELGVRFSARTGNHAFLLRHGGPDRIRRPYEMYGRSTARGRNSHANDTGLRALA